MVKTVVLTFKKSVKFYIQHDTFIFGIIVSIESNLKSDVQ